MTTGHYNYMVKDGVIERVPANKWAHYRKQGYDFSTKKDFLRQQNAAPEVEVVEEKQDADPTMALRNRVQAAQGKKKGKKKSS